MSKITNDGLAQDVS